MIRYIIILLILIALSGCSGYQIEGEDVYYIEWNESAGRVKRDISADGTNFKIFENENYGADNEKVYFQGNSLESADPSTFTPLAEFVAKDKNHGYCGSLLIPDSDGKTFESISDNYTRDKNDVYYSQHPLSSQNPRGFERLKKGHGFWSRDGISYYYNNQKVPIKDYQSFTILDDDCFFAKDKYQVYNAYTVLKGVDAKSFEFIQNCVGKDKYGCHNLSERCECPTEKQ